MSSLPAIPRSSLHAAGTPAHIARSAACLLLLVLAPLAARAQHAAFRIPPVQIPLDVKGQPITLTTSAVLTVSNRDRKLWILQLQLTSDLSDLQRNLTPLLSSQMDKDDRCGERIAIKSATLTPADPASVATIQLHFERWQCAKVLGRQISKRLIGGNAQVPVRLAPSVDDGASLRLTPEVGRIQADGSLGEALRSDVLRNTIQEKVQKAILNALEKSTNVGATLPPAVQGYVTIQNAAFRDAGDGRLLVVLNGEVRITQQQAQELADQVKQRVAARRAAPVTAPPE